MAKNLNLIEFPDHVLQNICSNLRSPFDLLNFGSTCKRLHNISLNQHLWWSLAFHWCRGLWMYIKVSCSEENPRKWLLSFMKYCTMHARHTTPISNFTNGEMWQRTDSRRFRCILGMFHMICSCKDDITIQNWLYDVGLFRRMNHCIDFTVNEYSDDIVVTLTALGQAVINDLSAKSESSKELKLYIRYAGTADGNWIEKLFSNGPYGSTCPLLLSPYPGTPDFSNVHEVHGLGAYVSFVLEQHLKHQYQTNLLPLENVRQIIRDFCFDFLVMIFILVKDMHPRQGPWSLKSDLLKAVSNNTIRRSFQKLIENYRLNFSGCDILSDLAKLLKKYEHIDFVLEQVRTQLKELLIDEIKYVLFPSGSSNSVVTRINLTDSDLIGGDNSMQQMSSAAFISDHGVLVTWHASNRSS